LHHYPHPKMKPSNLYIVFLLFSFGISAQDFQLKDVWHLKKGDFNKDSLNSIRAKNKLHLKYNEIVFFELKPPTNQALNYEFRIPKTEQFGQWRDIGSVPIVQIPALNGGDYEIEISTIESKEKTLFKFPINVQQPFWQESWFWPLIALYIVLIIGIGLYLFFLYDFRQKLKMQYVRNQIASDLHDEVGSNLNSIAIFVEVLRKKVAHENVDVLSLLSKITDNSEETVSLMRDTVWAINPANDSTEKLIAKMRSFAVETLSAKGISFDFQVDLGKKSDDFSMDQRRNLYLIYKEAINNIVKHAEATKAFCKIYAKQGTINIEIHDNGKGFDLSKTFEGNGLNNFKLRSQENDLHVSVDSVPEQGTSILIEVSA
jgi:nitrate/nitrite-specific signal transduction histidine kinase